MDARIINGFVVVFDDGYAIAVDKEVSLPYSALSCELSDGCKDYD